MTLLFEAQLQPASSRKPSLVLPRLETPLAIFGYTKQGHSGIGKHLIKCNKVDLQAGHTNRASCPGYVHLVSVQLD